MEPAPPPPHERQWRHPSELAAAERAAVIAEPAPLATRRLLIATGAVGVLVIGLLVATFSPTALTPTEVAATTMPTGTRRASAAIGVASQQSVVRPLPANVVPLNDRGLAVTTRTAINNVAGDTGAIQVVLPDGSAARARVITSGDDAVVVQLDRASLGYDISRREPADSEIVTIMLAPPVTIAFIDIDSLDSIEIPDGTPILDRRGELVGLCGHDGIRTEVIDVTDEYEFATTANR